MAVRVLLVLAAFAVLYGCGREGSPVEKQEQAAGVERSAPASEPPPVPDQRSQDAILQEYLDQMSILMLDKGLNGLYEGGAKGHREVRTLARARTLAALERLGPARKRLVVLFLMEASLIQNAPGEEPVMDLVGADLSGVDLTYSASGDAQPYASMPVADLSSADLTYADLSDADLGIVMHGARLVGADLRRADLSGAVIHDANLSGANLSGATGKTAEQLDGQAGSLEGAIMPDGQKYGDWLEYKGGREGAK
jgi:pentapeptide repeat protein